MRRTAHRPRRAPADLDRCATAAVACLRRSLMSTTSSSSSTPMIRRSMAPASPTKRSCRRHRPRRCDRHPCHGRDVHRLRRLDELSGSEAAALDEIEDGDDLPARDARGREPRCRASNASDRSEVARCITALDAHPSDALAGLRPASAPVDGSHAEHRSRARGVRDGSARRVRQAALADPRDVAAGARGAMALDPHLSRRCATSCSPSGSAMPLRRAAPTRGRRRGSTGDADQPDFPVRLAGDGSRPDPERVHRAREFVRALAGRAPNPPAQRVPRRVRLALLGARQLIARGRVRRARHRAGAPRDVPCPHPADDRCGQSCPAGRSTPNGQPAHTHPWMLANV